MTFRELHEAMLQFVADHPDDESLDREVVVRLEVSNGGEEALHVGAVFSAVVDAGCSDEPVLVIDADQEPEVTRERWGDSIERRSNLRASSGEIVLMDDLDRAAGRGDPTIAGHAGRILARAALVGDQAALDEFHERAGLVIPSVLVRGVRYGEHLRLVTLDRDEIVTAPDVAWVRERPICFFSVPNRDGAPMLVDAADLVGWIRSAEGTRALGRRGISEVRSSSEKEETEETVEEEVEEEVPLSPESERRLAAGIADAAEGRVRRLDPRSLEEDAGENHRIDDLLAANQRIDDLLAAYGDEHRYTRARFEADRARLTTQICAKHGIQESQVDALIREHCYAHTADNPEDEYIAVMGIGDAEGWT